MLKDFGVECPATGFALGIERILDARKFQNVIDNASTKKFYLSYTAGCEEAAIRQATELRAAGEVVEISLTAQTQAEADTCAEKFFAELIYVE